MFNRFWKYHQSNCAAPETAGAEKLVPALQVYRGASQLTPGTATQSAAALVTGHLSGNSSKESQLLTPYTELPGATRSGLNLPSSVLPNAEKPEISKELFWST